MSKYLVEIQHLNKTFSAGRKKEIRAVRDVSFGIQKGETVGLVGESGCGKTTLGKCLVRLYQPTDGVILYDGKSLSGLSKEECREFAGKVQMIFQSTYASLDPSMTVRDIVAEGIRLYEPELSRGEIDEKVRTYLETVGLGQAHMSRYPHEFSGGQCQRIGIARALAIEPEFIVCDEPVSALDVSIQAQILNILRDLKKKFHLTYLFISHDLNVVKYISDRVLVMYLGEIVEEAKTEELFSAPMHPYTEMLLSAIPIADPIRAKKDRKSIIKGELPDAAFAESGCLFAERCPYTVEKCYAESPKQTEISPAHFVRCHRCQGSI